MLLGAWPLGGRNTSNSPPAKSGKVRFLFLCGGYMLFLVIGAAIFSAIEAPKMEQVSKKITTVRTKFLKDNPCLNGKFLFESN